MRICIIADHKSSAEHQNYIRTLKSWTCPTFEDLDIDSVFRTVSLITYSIKHLLIRTQVNKMILERDGADSSAKPVSVFSEDILQIEIAGPDKDHLSVIECRRFQTIAS